MGAWFICRDDARAERRLAEARDQLAKSGHAPPKLLATKHHKILISPHIHAGLPAFVQVGEDFAAVAGTFFYRGEGGEAALKRLIADFEPPFARWDDVLGHFAAVVYKNGRLFVFTDWAAHFFVYQSADKSVVSTSFLATARSLDRLSFHPQSVYEYTFAGTPMGDDTVFTEITKPARTHQLELGETVRVYDTPRPLPVVPTKETADELIDRIAKRMRAMFAVPARLYGNNIQCPLSGGFDSRLVLSLFMDAGVRPQLYVYGKKTDTDVVIASEIAKQEGFPLEIFEKAAFRKVEPDEYPSIAEHNFHEMDGTPIDGGMFDAGGNSQGRHNRAKGGALAASGAAGEIFRNYFYLADRPHTTKDIIHAFWSAIDPAECTSLFDERAYTESLDKKLQAALGVGGERQNRLDIERAYPLFRCPVGFGREISLVGRFGAYFVPFCEHAAIAEAANIPVRLRTHGVFQSQLMQRINPRMAAYQSAYGHSFAEQPSLNHRLADAVSLYRPPWLRRYTYRVRKALGQKFDTRPGLMTDRYLERVVDTKFPIMSRFFHMERLLQPLYFKSAACLEYLGHHFADRLR